MQLIFCPQCADLILDAPACPACGWQRPIAIGDAGKQVWRAELGRALPKPQCSAVIAGGRYCLSAEDGTIVALDLETGRVAWERAIDAGYATHALAADGARLLVSSVDARPIPVRGRPLLALDAETGQDVWQYSTMGHSLSAAALADGTAYFSSSDSILHAVDPATGERRWQIAHASWGPAAPAIADNVVCVGGRGNELCAYTAENGAELWRFTATDSFAGAIVLADGSVYAPCWDGNLYALEARSGRLLWKYKGERGEGITSTPAVAGGRVFLGSRVYRNAAARQDNWYALLALRAEDGAEIWRFLTEQHIFAAPGVAGDSVLFGANDGFCYALDSATGEQRWKVELNGRIVTQPLIAGDLAYVGERHGTVYALRWRAKPQERAQPADVCLRQGAYEQAAIAHALGGDFAAAAGLYEQPLGQPREAALLYERAGQPAQAARLWEGLGEPRRARDLYQAVGDLPGVARMLEALGEPLQAAKLYEQIGDPAAAALYEQTGDRVKAADLYHSTGQLDRATQIWQSLGQWERLVDALIGDGNRIEAARLLEQHDQHERAAELYEAAAQLDQALVLRAQLGHWERVANLAFRLSDYTQEARAHEQLGHTLGAAEAYERAARQIGATMPANDERAAQLYERAAQLYAAAFEDQRANLCRREFRRFRRLPEITVSGGAESAFVEYEWNTLKLRVRNTGYGRAANITMTLRGPFDVDGNTEIASLAPKKPAVLEVSVRPQREQYGPAVPLEIVVTFADMHGGKDSVRRRIPIRVLQQGAVPGITTPLEINIPSERPPRSAARATELPSREVIDERPNDPSAGEEEIEQQQSLLKAHRRTLTHLLNQLALVGGAAYATPQVINGIGEARENIQRVKQSLRDWGVAVADHPKDRSEMS